MLKEHISYLKDEWVVQTPIGKRAAYLETRLRP